MDYHFERSQLKVKVWRQKFFQVKMIAVVLLVTIILLVIIPILILLMMYYQYSGLIKPAADLPNDINTIVVLGANVQGTALQERVHAAADLYRAGNIKRIILSGNDLTTDPAANEVARMIELALAEDIPDHIIQVDNKSLRTYDTCYHLKHDWNLNEVILVSQKQHLTRALYICNSLGVKSFGYSATVDEGFREDWIREAGAMLKALIDINVSKPEMEPKQVINL